MLHIFFFFNVDYQLDFKIYLYFNMWKSNRRLNGFPYIQNRFVE